MLEPPSQSFDTRVVPEVHMFRAKLYPPRGMGVYILRPHAAGILYAPPFYTPPTPKRVFSGVGGVGVYKIWPRSNTF